MDDAPQNREDVVLGFISLLVFDVLVPERVCQEVESDTICSTVEESVMLVSESFMVRRREESGAVGRGMGCEHYGAEHESSHCDDRKPLSANER